MRTENSSGVVVVQQQEGMQRFLLLHQTNDVWSFPKGHIEEGETAKTAALRELEEETGITDILLIDVEPIMQEYTFIQGGEQIHKVNCYFVGTTDSTTLIAQPMEVIEYLWATYEEAVAIFTTQALTHGFTHWQEVLDAAVLILSQKTQRGILGV